MTINIVTLFILCNEVIFLIYKTNICTYNIHNSTISYFLLHVSAATRPHQGENTNLFKTE
jgi:hypothetical protein